MVDGNNPYKFVFIVASIACIICVLPSLYSIVWFERFGSTKERTVINKLFSSICLAGMLTNFFVQVLYIFRFAYGPLPAMVCFVLCLTKRVIINYALLMLDLISLIRYIFIYWLKNPAAFKDEFWCVFLNLWCILISISFQIVRATVPGNHLVEYSMCTGNDPTPFFYLPSFGRGYIESFSLIIQIIVYIKIWLYKIKARKAIGPQGYSSYLKNIFINDLDKQSLTGVAPDIALGLSIASGSVLIVAKTFKCFQIFLLFTTRTCLRRAFLAFCLLFCGS